jgi:hypothetical protein
MKKIVYSILFLSALFFIPGAATSQQKAAYQVPDSYNFDYEVVQQVNAAGKSPTTITYYYSQTGDYTAMSGDPKNNNLVINTKDGNTIIIDNQKKSLVIMRMQNMMGDIGKIAEQYTKNNPSAVAPSKHDSSNFKFAKTGNTKQVSSYTSEEYGYTDSKGQKGSVWYAKVDFNASMFFMFGAGRSPASAGMNKYAPSSTSYPQFTDPHMLVTEMESNNHPGDKMTTQSISKKSMVITTKGYAVTNLSNMMGQ